MNLTIDISVDLEARLVKEATKRGIGLDEFIMDAVRSRLASNDVSVPSLDAEESRLLEEINQGLSQTEWDRYYKLVDRRRSGRLSEDELTELEEASNRIEDLNARRMECLAELARLRGTTLTELLDQLGIGPPPVI